ncbi:MAG: AAA family ATPase [Pacificimonas sp.]
MNEAATTSDADLAELDRLAARFAAAREEVGRVVIGQDEVVDQMFAVLLAGGHGLLMGLPGLAKTRLVTTLGTVLALDTRRVQFTPDLVPSDILGAEILDGDANARSFRFVEGPIFTQLLMADEINRASPRTQSALLEAMQERQVTVTGEARPLPRPFHVLATQNPIEQDGTYPLPEAQLDRFLMRIDIEAPSEANERAMLTMTTGANDAMPTRMLAAGDLEAAQGLLLHMPIGDDVMSAVLTVVRGLRPDADGARVRWGPGPRAGQALIGAARARAFLEGRSAPLLDDVAKLAAPALRHRMALDYGARQDGLTPDDLIVEQIARL